MSFAGWLLGSVVGVLATVVGVIVLGMHSVLAAFLLGLVVGAVSSFVGANYRRIFR